jgi:hypothetical protein
MGKSMVGTGIALSPFRRAGRTDGTFHARKLQEFESSENTPFAFDPICSADAQSLV